jgi:hypothetical protein
MYIYPDNLRAKSTLWLWELRDVGIVGAGLIVSVFAMTRTGLILPVVPAAVYGFLSIRSGDTSILDFIRSACAFFITQKQFYEWRMNA